jgi:hypothetical protein
MTKGSMELSAAISHCVARPCARVLGQQRLAPFADVQHDGAGFEQHEAVVLENRHLAERLQRAVVGLVLVALLEQARLVRQSGLFERPACA